MAAAVESPHIYPESPMDLEDVVYPCKGCGEILEEGKAFELAGNRWHIDCFRCNTCGTLLDSDANLLLLGDGSLICNNCTYSCSACGNKIEDLAILTGDQAFCSGCFRCRNCKRKIENLRYARTSQGIFCMSCHESLMARRRKKARTPKASTGGTPVVEKALPSLPPGAAQNSAFTPEGETPPDYAESRSTPQQSQSPRDAQLNSRGGTFKRDVSPLSDEVRQDGPTLPASTYNDGRPSNVSTSVDDDDDGSEQGFLPMAFDPTPIQPGQPPSIQRKQLPRSKDSSPPTQKENLPPRDYFGTNGRLAAPKQPQRDQQMRGALSRDDRAGSGSSREVSMEREPQDTPGRQKPSPHIYYQEKGRSRDRENTSGDTPTNGSNTASPAIGNDTERITAKPKGPPLATDSTTLSQSQKDGFKLQEVPKTAKERSQTSTRQGTQSPAAVSPLESNNREGKISQPISPVSVDSQRSVNPFEDPKRRKAAQTGETPLLSKHTERGLPLRGDSLNAAAQKAKSAPSDPSTPTAAPSTMSTLSSTASTLVPSQHSSHDRQASTSSVHSAFTDAHSTLSRDDTRSRPTEPPVRGSFDAVPPRSANRPSAPSKSVANDDFIAPRHAPPPPPVGHKAADSISTMHSTEERPSIDEQLSPGLRSTGLPKYSLDGGFSMDDEMGRILRGEQSPSQEGDERSTPSVLRRVSNAVKHGRSFSDRAATSSKSPKNSSLDMTSPGPMPNITSPTSTDGLDSLRASLRRAQLHIAELESEKLGLQDKLDGSSEIKAVNTELREKRSTMAFLDTQREMVVRELEIMTEHLTKAKDNSQPLDLASLKTSILKDFAESLQKLKDNMGSQIEELMHKRNELTDEIGNLIQMKDKGFQEYENLSSKNTQLMQHNSELLRSIQGVYQDNRGPNGSANGLGIYHPGAKVETPGASDIRSLNLVSTDPSMPNLLQDPDAESATVLTAPQVVNIRKGGKPNKFNWRRGGEKITDKVTKGIKGAFVGGERAQSSHGHQYAIGLPYNATQASGGSELSSAFPKGADEGKSGASYFFGQKGGATKPGLGNMKNDSSTNLVVAADASVLFGSELAARCNFEGRVIPSVVLRCIQEVEKRGLDQEGIYRKSGGAGQVKVVQQGFEADQEYDISDPDLDIHAVTSTLKQYFRKLPTPLIVYDAYDGLLEAGQLQDKEKQVTALRLAVDDLPEAHRECLAYLLRHLALVMSSESQNLMTALNLAVVFAPTIMRPLSIEREMSDMQAQRNAVMALLQHHKSIFESD